MYNHNVVKANITFTIMAILALIVITYMPTSEALKDPYVDEVMYSKDSTESFTLVQSGRDNATYYRYLIIDVYSEAPANLSEAGFNYS